MMLKVDNKVKDFIQERNIKSLYHFTKADNLHGILRNGLLSRKTMNENGISYLYNDNNRLEGRLEANCLSIGFPNYKMFYKYRMRDKDCEWCILELSPKILYEKECLFCIENAASKSETRRMDEDKKGIRGLERLYLNENLRREAKLRPDFTTNPQAEVLVLDDIGTEYIEKIYFESLPIRFPFNNYIGYSFYTCKDLFSPRRDYSYWR